MSRWKKASAASWRSWPATSCSLALALILAVGCARVSEARPDAAAVRTAGEPMVIDVHAHLSARAWRFAMAVMRDNRLAMMVNLSGGNSPRDFARHTQVTEATGGRIVHFYNPNWAGLESPGWGWREAMALRRAVVDHGYKGLKISKGLGLGARLPGGVLLPVDDAILDPLWAMAGALGVPVAIHTGDPRAFWAPLDESNERWTELRRNPSWSYHERHDHGEVPSWLDLLDAFVEVVRRHPGTDFIGVHFGNAPERIDLVAAWLERYPNLYVDIAARVGEIGRHPAKAVRELFERFSDRILFGTDIGISPYGLMLGAPGEEPSEPDDIKPFYDLHWRWLETTESPMPHPVPIQGDWPVHGVGLPPEILRKVYADNARRLLRL